MQCYTADFETNNHIEDCRVWAWSLSEISDGVPTKVGTTIDSFINEMIQISKFDSPRVYFHNLKFDAEFIINFLFLHNFTFVNDRSSLKTHSFTTTMSDNGMFYQLIICFYKKGHHIRKVTFYDSLKLIPRPVEKIAKDFHLQISKLKINYNERREQGHKLTPDEEAYVMNDTKIMALVLKDFLEMGMDKLTIGGCALKEMKASIGTKNWKMYFPKPTIDEDELFRLFFRGGFCFVNPKFKGLRVGAGIVLDVNSLYPSIMYYEMLPYGKGVYFTGKYETDELYPLYLQAIRCIFTLKQGKIPSIQCKNNLYSGDKEYLTSSDREEMTLYLTNIDLALFFEQYEVENETYLWGYKFKGSNTLFRPYIDKWTANKIQAKKEGNWSLYMLSKLMLNNAYGKLTTNPRMTSKYPTYEEGRVVYKKGEEEIKDPVYLPAGLFIPSYGRAKLIRAAQENYERFAYCDTDSLHLVGTTLPKNIEIDKYKLGAFDLEMRFSKARYLHCKCYMEMRTISRNIRIKNASRKTPTHSNRELQNVSRETLEKYEKLRKKITIAGLPERCYNYKEIRDPQEPPQYFCEVTWRNFNYGSIYEGKLAVEHTKGGIVLVDTTFEIKET